MQDLFSHLSVRKIERVRNFLNLKFLNRSTRFLVTFRKIKLLKKEANFREIIFDDRKFVFARFLTKESASISLKVSV